MILVTGAAGKTGRSIIRSLVAKGVTVRAFVHRREQVQTVESLGASQTIVGDMCDRSTMERAVQGIRAIYHICPNVSPDEVAIGQMAISAAQSANVEHFVYHSVLHPQIEAMPHHWHKMRVEEQLIQSGLPFTILQPSVYHQNLLTQWDQILNQGIYAVPYSVETQLSMVDLLDVAQAATIVLTEPGHVGAMYELSGTHPLPQIEVAAILSQSLSRTVTAKSIPLDTWEREARAAGLGSYQIETLLAMFRHYDQYGLRGNARVLEWLIGRPPTTISEFVDRERLKR
ncbi:MAG: NmrA family NAD(P)-binding protein, partial [Anaerolineales bacterium]|nr:NmrA family NAD(P)-binding protein [Anaerolineales bacterium]